MVILNSFVYQIIADYQFTIYLQVNIIRYLAFTSHLFIVHVNLL